MAEHTVKPGDCFNSIAKKYGFYNYLTLFNSGKNSTLCGDKTNPNMLIEGKVVEIPDKKPKKIKAKLDQEQRFVIDRKKTKLRLIVADCEEKELTINQCKLVVGSVNGTKPDGFKGLIEIEIDPAELAGTLSFTIPAPPPVVSTSPSVSGSAPSPPPHPPTIKADEFQDKLDPLNKDPIDVKWTLKIGFLEPVEEVRGAIQRLYNLGCKTPDPAGTKVESDETKRIVKSYQNYKAKKKDEQTGELKDIRDFLTAAHDKQ